MVKEIKHIADGNCESVTISSIFEVQRIILIGLLHLLCSKVNEKGSVYMERAETRKKMLELQYSEIELVSERAKFWLYLDTKLKDLDDAKFKTVFTALHHRRIRTEDTLMKAIEFLKDGVYIRGIGPVIKEILLSVNV